MADLKTLGQWFDEGVAQGATHMIVKRDWFDESHYPVFAKDLRAAQKLVNTFEVRRRNSLITDPIIEVYNLRKPKGPQLIPGELVWDLEDTPDT